jgi:rhamnosyltransferase
MKNIFIIGSQGYNKNYGGWETFVKYFADNYDKKKANIYVGEISHSKDDKEYISNNITCHRIYTPKIKSATMMLYSIKSLYFYLDYVKRNKIDNPIFIILGLKMGPYLKILKPKFKEHNIKVYVNPDGLEWKRSKWNWLVKKYFLYAERSMLANCHGIICDAKGIKTYIEEKYPEIKIPKYYIAYGADSINLEKSDENKVLKEYNLEKNNYCLVVGRCVPENNFELIINEFMNSKIDKELVIISNIRGNKYYETLISKTNCSKDKRIRILDGIYDKEKLSIIRKNAYLYLHGHSVGGTNPSLLEAMSLTDLNLLYDVNFNREVGEKTCLYFNSSEGNLSSLLDNKELLDKNQKQLGKLAKERIKNNFTWEIVVKKYEDIFK